MSRKRTNLIKYMLKTAFPDTKFSVRTRGESTSESININWVDGPTEEQVDEATKLRHHFENVSRDDITHEILLGGNTYFFYERSYSPESLERCKNAVNLFMGVPSWEAKHGRWRIDQWIQEQAWRIWKKTDFRGKDPKSLKVYGLIHHGPHTYLRLNPKPPSVPVDATHVIDQHGFREITKEEKETGKTKAELEKRWFKNTDQPRNAREFL